MSRVPLLYFSRGQVESDWPDPVVDWALPGTKNALITIAKQSKNLLGDLINVVYSL
jgi:hypothetical protein